MNQGSPNSRQRAEGRAGLQPGRLSCPTCGSAISSAATRSCSCCARAFPNGRSTCWRPRCARRLPTTCPACARPSSSICRASGWRLSQHNGAGAALAARGLWHGADHAADLEVGARAVSRRHSGAHRLCRRSPLRPAQRHALRRTEAAAHGRPVCGRWPCRVAPRLPADWPMPRARRTGSRGSRLGAPSAA